MATVGDIPRVRNSWTHKALTVTTQGLDALGEEDTRLLMNEMEAERRRRLEEASKRRQEQEATKKSREEEYQRKAALVEKEARAQMDALDAQRSEKMKAWKEKVRERDLLRAQEKQEMRELISKQELAHTARLQNADVPRSTSPVTRVKMDPIKVEPDRTAEITSCTHLCELPRVGIRLRRPPDTSRDRYDELMEDTNYARSIELASSVYSKKLIAKRR